MKPEIEITFGVFGEPIGAQVVRQGFQIEANESEKLQRHAAAIERLAIHGILTDSERSRARKKLMKKIADAVEKVQVPNAAPVL